MEKTLHQIGIIGGVQKRDPSMFPDLQIFVGMDLYDLVACCMENLPVCLDQIIQQTIDLIPAAVLQCCEELSCL